MFTALFIGRSGCGKGTQAQLLVEYLKKKFPNDSVFYLATGDAFRKFVVCDNYSADLAKKIMDEGGLQPSFLAVNMWSNLMIEKMRGSEHIVADGLSRYLEEAQALDSAFKFYNREQVHVVYINVSNDWARERLTARARADDHIESINRRLGWFEEHVMQSVDYYRNNPDYIFHDINGQQSINEVHQNIVRNLNLA